MKVKSPTNAQRQPPKVLRSKDLEWIILDLTDSNDVSWLERDGGLDEDIVELFLERGQAIVQLQLREGTFVRILHAKLGKDSSEDQSVDLGFWIEARRVITFRQGPSGPLIERLEAEFGSAGGPSSPWRFFASAVSRFPSYTIP